MIPLSEKMVVEAGDPDDKTRAEIVDRATQSVKWTVFASLAPRVITPVATIILAALLTPDDFGVVAISTLVISLAQIVTGLGMVSAIIQRQASDVLQAATNAFWINMIAGLCLYVSVWLLAPGVAGAYHIPVLKDVLRVSGLALPVHALGSIPHALLQRELNFRRLFWVSVSLLVVPAMVAVLLAFMGVGFWALIVGSLTGSIASIAVAWFSVSWRPRFHMERSITPSLLGFGIWSLITALQTWLFSYADNALAGLYFGAAGVGIYAMGFTLAGLIPGFAASVIATVAYPAFCELYRRGEALRDTLIRLQELMAIILFPLAFGVSAVAEETVTQLYGNRWSGLGLVIGWLAIFPGITNLWSLNAEAYRAVGRADILAKLSAVGLAIMFPLLLITGPLGLTSFTIARFAGAMFLPLLNILVTARILGISAKQQLNILVVPLAASLVMFIVVRLFLQVSEPFNGLEGWFSLLVSIILGALIYFGITWWFRRDVVLQIVRALRKIIING